MSMAVCRNLLAQHYSCGYNLRESASFAGNAAWRARWGTDGGAKNLGYEVSAMLKQTLLAVITATALLALASCGTNNSTSLNPDLNNGNAAVSSFALDVMDETFDYGAAAD